MNGALILILPSETSDNNAAMIERPNSAEESQAGQGLRSQSGKVGVDLETQLKGRDGNLGS